MATNLSFVNSLYIRFLGKEAPSEQRQLLTQEISDRKQANPDYTEFHATADFVADNFETKHFGDIPQHITAYYEHFTQTPTIDELLDWAEQEPVKSSSEITELMGFLVYDVYAISINNLPSAWEVSLPTNQDSINENEQLDYTVAVTDATLQSIEYAIDTSKGDGNFFEIDRATGRLSFKQLPNFEEKNTYIVNVSATNTETAVDSFTSISFTVNDINESPQFTSATSTTVTANDTESFYTAEAQDPESNSLTFAINNPANSGVARLLKLGDCRHKK